MFRYIFMVVRYLVLFFVSCTVADDRIDEKVHNDSVAKMAEVLVGGSHTVSTSIAFY